MQHLVLASASKRNGESDVKKLVARVGYASSGTELWGERHEEGCGGRGRKRVTCPKGNSKKLCLSL